MSDFLKTIFAPKKPVQIEPVIMPEKPTLEITRAGICTLMAEEFKLISGHKETGDNTDNGGVIDKVILTAGGRIGWPYCALMVTYITMKVCEKLNISYPKNLYRGASSQQFMHSTNKIYISSTLKPWSAFVHTNPGQTVYGHIGFVYSQVYNKDYFQTAEGNYSQQINYFDKQLSYVNKFVDIPQAILDQYNYEKTR